MVEFRGIQMPEFITTYSGKKFHFLNPQAEDICIEDIAKALSMSCRYNGHVSDFYSVAEHSVIIADLVYNIQGCPYEALCALLHDASEAYLTDIPRPIKPHLTNYHELEAKAEAAIESVFALEPMNTMIKYFDTHIVRDEAEQLFKDTPTWVNDYDRIGIKVYKWSPVQAEREFLQRFKQYSDQI